VTTREGILDSAKAIVTADRNVDYGTPEQNFQTIAELWTCYLQYKYIFDAHEVAVMMMLLKISRLQTSPHKEDHWIDIAGYAACGGEVRPTKR
jgi:Domain of unknown function (DUF6378)